MGRFRRYPTDKHNVKKRTAFDDTEKVDERVEQRLGLDKQVCTSCDAANPKRAGKCRKCDSNQLRSKNSEFADE